MDYDVDGGVAMTVLPVPGSDDVIVLLDPDRRPDGVLPWHPFHNLVRLEPSGVVRWRAELVPGESTAKCWMSAGWANSTLWARTYSWECGLDPATGRIACSRFTK